MKDHTGRDEVILAQALLLPPEGRAGYLEQACGNDLGLRRRVEALLQTREQTGDVLDEPFVVPPTLTDWPSELPRPAVVGERVGGYKLLQQIGEGGGGIVFMAEQEKPVRRRVALKIIKLGMDTVDVIGRFEAERQALAMMDHPNIARVLDAGATPTGRPYFVMELVRGTPITQFCNDNKLSIAERLKLLILVCSAVQHAHQKGIIHRDIKPSNILVTLHDGVPVPKVIDFGIAKAMGGRLTDKTYFTAFEQFIGTPAYMSPEQAEMSNLDADTRSDIYSLGVLLYELLTGCTPLDQEKLKDAGVDEIRRCIREDEPPRPSTRLGTLVGEALTTAARQRHTEAPKLISHVRGDLDWIVMRCLEKDRRRRYESASALAQDLQNYLDNEPVSARPPSTLYLLQKMARRHRVVFTAGAAITAALVLGLGAATRSYYSERQARQSAEEEKQRANQQAALAQTAEKETAQQKHEVQIALSRADYLMAINLVADDKLPEALAHLVRALRSTPDDRAAAALLCSILTTSNWLVPVSVVETSTAATPPGRGRGGQNARGRGPGPGRQFGAQEQPNAVLATSLDGKRALRRAESGGPVQLFDTASGQPISAAIQMEGGVRSAKFSADGRQIVVESRSRDRVSTWNYLENSALLLVIPGASPTSFLEESADGHRLLTVFADNAVHIWDAANGQPVSAPIKNEQPLRSAIFSPDGQRILTIAQNNVLKVWDVEFSREISSLALDEMRPGGGRGGPPSAVFSPDGQRILAVMGGAAQMFDAATGKPALPPLHADQRISSAAFSPDGRRILTASTTARIWDSGSGGQVLEFAKDSGQINSAAFSPDGKQVVTGSSSGQAQIWDTTAGQAVFEAMHQGEQNLFAHFSPDGSRVLTSNRGQGSAARVWDAATGQPLSALMQNKDNLESAAFSADGRWVITLAQGARIWDADTGLPVSVPLSARRAKLSPDGQRIITLGVDGMVRVWPFSDEVGPGWILDLAETLAQCRLDKTGSLVFYQGKSVAELQRLAAPESNGGQPMVLWARRLLGLTPPVEEPVSIPPVPSATLFDAGKLWQDGVAEPIIKKALEPESASPAK